MNNFFSTRANPFSRRFLSLSIATLIVFCVVLPGSLFAESDLPSNLGPGLRQLVSEQQQSLAAAAPSVRGRIQLGLARRAVRDADHRVLVKIHLDGKTPLSDMKSALPADAHVTAESGAYRNGVLSAYVPINRLVALARSPGVLSISLSRRPILNVGKTTSGGVPVIRSDLLNAQGIDGSGITVGVLSDSYDTATTDLDDNPLTVHAADDVASDDLPGTGNANNPNPVVVLEDFTPGPGDFPGFDEGRAMLQIVHDVAPKSKLAYATAVTGDVAFANNIRRLRTEANCDVIVDDVLYFDEPFFSDGIIAQAADDVVNSSSLPGPKCAYFSSAGNQQGGGYVSTFQAVPDATARAGIAGQNLDLSQVPAELTSGGFHNFNPDLAALSDISQTFFLPAGSNDDPTSVEIVFQWNDPFDLPNGVTTDYNILLFDALGNYLAAISGTEDNFATQEPLEDVVMMNTSGATTFQVVISRAGNSPVIPVASKLRYFATDQFGSGAGAAEYYQPNAPSTFGHNSANGALGTAAYVYDDIPSNPPGPPFMPVLEDFTSAGPVTIDFDPSGNRLLQSEIRQKPDIAAPDGGNTTFFGFDYEEDGFPNFFGTSAAAPHAAGVAALLLQKAGGPGSLTLPQIKTALQNSVRSPHDVDPFFSQVILTPRHGRRTKRAAGSSATITASGNGSNASSRDPNFFTINFTAGKPGQTLENVTIDMSEIDLKFDATADTGFPFTLGRLVGISANNITTNIAPGTDGLVRLTIAFTSGTFTSAVSVSFGIDRDFVGDGGGNSADLLQRANVSGNLRKGRLFGAFRNTFGTGYSIADGFGLIDAFNAAQRVP
jgi:hypothetical protein